MSRLNRANSNIATEQRVNRPVITRNVLTELKKVWSKANYTVRVYSITDGADFSYRGFIDAGLQLSGQNNWTSDLGGATSQLQQMLRTVSQGAGMYESLRGLANAIGSSGIKSAHETLQAYESSTPPIFSVTSVIVSFEPEINVLDSVLNLFSMVMPYKQGNFAFINPLKYIPMLSSSNIDDLVEFKETNPTDFGASGSLDTKANLVSGGSGTLTLAIGKYFFATGMICNDVSASFSKEVVDDGTPLYATVTFSFRPKIQPDFFQYKRYFRGANQNSFGKNGSTDPNQVQGYAQIELVGQTIKDTTEDLVAPIAQKAEKVLNRDTTVITDLVKTFFTGG